MRNILSVVFCGLALLAIPATASPGSILDGYKAAVGGKAWAGKRTLATEFAIEAYGMTGTVTTQTDLADGRSVDRTILGPIRENNGYDGKTVWMQDQSGTVTPQEGGDVRELTANQVYRNTNAWWRTDRGGAAIVATEAHENGAVFDVLTITPKGGKPFEAWFDRPSHILVKLVEQQGAQTVVTRMSDYAAFAGVKLARKVSIDSGKGEKYIVKTTLTRATFGPVLAAKAYAPPTVRAKDFAITGGASQTTIPIRIISNHIYGEVSVNGKGPYLFIFDTGGMNLMTPTLAKALGLKVEGALPTTGAGEGVMEGGVTHVDTISIGDAVLKDQTSYLFPLDSMSSIEGIDEIGMIGFETFRRFVTCIDYGAKTLTLIDPTAFDPKTAGTEIPFTFSDHNPQVAGSFEGIPAKFQIDTGSRSELTVNKPFAVRNGLRATRKGVDAIDGWGVGGPSTGYVTRGREIAIGPVKIENIVATLSDQDKGAFSGDDYNGNIGGGILKRFVVTFDYGHQKMYLKPLGTVADTGTYDRAGMWFNLCDNGYRIVAVTKGGPAEAAGLRQGDVIVAIDGKPAKALPLYETRRRLRNDAAGTVVVFDILRDGKSASLSVTLKDLI